MESAAVNAGLPPSELIVSIGPIKDPWAPISKDCNAPGVFSFTVLLVESVKPHEATPLERHLLENTFVSRMQRYP